MLAAGSTSDLIGLPWRDLLHPEDRPLPGIRPAHRLGDLDQPVKRFVRRDGVTFEVTIREAQIPWRGRTAGLIVIGEWNNAPGEEPTHGLLGPVVVRALNAAGEGTTCGPDGWTSRRGWRPCWVMRTHRQNRLIRLRRPSFRPMIGNR